MTQKFAPIKKKRAKAKFVLIDVNLFAARLGLFAERLRLWIFGIQDFRFSALLTLDFRHAKLSAPIIKNWCSVLETSYIIHFIEADSNNLGKCVTKSPKMYFIDPGLMCYFLRLNSKEDLLLSDHKGAVVESAAVSELLKMRFNTGKNANLTYFRDTNGFEVDLIADWKKSFAIEIKSRRDTEKKLSANVRKYVDLREDGAVGKVFYLGDITCTINGVKYVSWRDWGAEA